MRIAVLVLVTACATEATPTFPNVVIDAAAPARTYAKPVKVDYMLRGYFYAYADKSEGLGGNARSQNFPKPIAEIANELSTSGGVHVLALVDQDRDFDGHNGFRVILANATSDPRSFDAQDARLYMIHEALDEHGTWKPIEYLPSSWCGNSYHRLELPPKTYWEFVAPHYDGDFATRLRIRVSTGKDDKTWVTYSNEFASRIDKRQFTNKQGHTPTNIMDPYED